MPRPAPTTTPFFRCLTLNGRLVMCAPLELRRGSPRQSRRSAEPAAHRHTKEHRLTSSPPNITDAAAAESLPFMPELFKTTAERGTVLIAGHCARCGMYSFPRRSICSRCGPGPNVMPTELNGQGRVYASTVIQVPSPVGLKPPYAYGYVDLEAVPLRVFGLFAEADASGMKPGTPVKLIAEPLYPDASGRTLLAYKFARA